MRCKVRLESVERSMYGSDREIRTVILRPVYGDDNPENKKFFAATPNGEIRLGIVNPDAVKEMKLGGHYYVDFTPAE